MIVKVCLSDYTRPRYGFFEECDCLWLNNDFVYTDYRLSCDEAGSLRHPACHFALGVALSRALSEVAANVVAGCAHDGQCSADGNRGAEPAAQYFGDSTPKRTFSPHHWR